MIIEDNRDKLLFVMRSKQMRQSDLAQSIGASQSIISRIIRGRWTPSRKLADKIEQATDGKVKAAEW